MSDARQRRRKVLRHPGRSHALRLVCGLYQPIAAIGASHMESFPPGGIDWKSDSARLVQNSTERCRFARIDGDSYPWIPRSEVVDLVAWLQERAHRFAQVEGIKSQAARDSERVNAIPTEVSLSNGAPSVSTPEPSGALSALGTSPIPAAATSLTTPEDLVRTVHEYARAFHGAYAAQGTDPSPISGVPLLTVLPTPPCWTPRCPHHVSCDWRRRMRGPRS